MCSGISMNQEMGMRFQPVKCNIMQLTRKHLDKIQASYILEGKFSKMLTISNTLVD